MKRLVIALFFVFTTVFIRGMMQEVVPSLYDQAMFFFRNNDIETAKKLLLQVLEDDEDPYIADKLLELSDELFEGNQKEKEKSINILEVLSKQTVNPEKHGVALLRLARLHELGQVYEKNFSKAAELYKQIIDDPTIDHEIRIEAFYYLGLLYFRGDENFPCNFAKSIEYLQQVSSQSTKLGIEAAYHIGFMYLYGEWCGIKENLAEAEKYLLIAINQTFDAIISVKAKSRLASVYIRQMKLDEAIQILKIVAVNTIDERTAIVANYYLANFYIDRPPQWDYAIEYLYELFDQEVERTYKIWAAKELAFIYGTGGNGIEKDLDKAKDFGQFVINHTDDFEMLQEMRDFLERIHALRPLPKL